MKIKKYKKSCHTFFNCVKRKIKERKNSNKEQCYRFGKNIKTKHQNCNSNIKCENQKVVNILGSIVKIMSEDGENEKIKAEREEMKEESHQLDLKEGYEQDEEYEESEE